MGAGGRGAQLPRPGRIRAARRDRLSRPRCAPRRSRTDGLGQSEPPRGGVVAGVAPRASTLGALRVGGRAARSRVVFGRRPAARPPRRPSRRSARRFRCVFRVGRGGAGRCSKGRSPPRCTACFCASCAPPTPPHPPRRSPSPGCRCSCSCSGCGCSASGPAGPPHSLRAISPCCAAGACCGARGPAPGARSGPSRSRCTTRCTSAPPPRRLQLLLPALLAPLAHRRRARIGTRAGPIVAGRGRSTPQSFAPPPLNRQAGGSPGETVCGASSTIRSRGASSTGTATRRAACATCSSGG